MLGLTESAYLVVCRTYDNACRQSLHALLSALSVSASRNFEFSRSLVVVVVCILFQIKKDTLMIVIA